MQSLKSRLFYKKVVLRNFAKFTGKDLCQSLFLIKLHASAQVFSVNFVKLLRTFFLYNTSSSCFCTTLEARYTLIIALKEEKSREVNVAKVPKVRMSAFKQTVMG